MESVSAFAARIKGKYPDYAEIPDAELVSRVIYKHPDYRPMVDLGVPDNGAPAQGMGDLKMAERQAEQPQPYETPAYVNAQRAGAQPGAWDAAKPVIRLAGDVGQSMSTGPVNAAVQGVQDNWGDPVGVFGGVLKNEAKSLANPVANLIGNPFETPVQSSSESLQRAGVDNTPQRPPMRYPGEQFPGGDAPMIGLADQAGVVADYLSPMAGAKALKLAGKAGGKIAEAVAEKTGKGLQDFAVGQSKSITPFLTRHIRDGAKHETFFKENLMGPKDEIFQKAKTTRKELGEQLGTLIKEGKDNGVTVNGLEEIDKMLAKHTADPGASLQSARITDPASQKFIEKAKKFITRISKNKDGVLDLKQAQTVKQWLQKQAEYTGPADAAGIPLVAAPNEAAQTAGDLGHQFRMTIEDVAPEGVKEINKRMNELYPVERAAGWRQMIRDRQPPVKLTDYVGLGQLITSPIWMASKAYGSGRAAKAIYNLGTKLRSVKTVKEAEQITNSLKRLGVTEKDLTEGMGPVQEANPGADFSGYQNDFPEWKIKQPKPEAPAVDPMEGMYPGNKPAQGGGTPGYEGMISPEDLAKRQAMTQADREALVRQARPVRIPKAKEAPGGVQVLDESAIKKQPYKPTIDRAPAEPAKGWMGAIEANNKRIQGRSETLYHGSSSGKIGNDAGMMQLSADPEVAKQYAGKSGSAWTVTPNEKTKILDMSNKETDKIAFDMYKDYQKGNLDFADELENSVGKSDLSAEDFKKIAKGFNPDEIVNSAEMWDNQNAVQWFVNKYDYHYIKTKNGGIVLDPSKVDKSPLSGSKGINQNQAKVDRLTKALEKAKDPQTKKKIEAMIAKELPF